MTKKRKENADLAMVVAFMESLQTAANDYKKQKNAEQLLKDLTALADSYREYFGFGDLILKYADDLIRDGDYDMGIRIIRLVYEKFSQIANITCLNIRLAEYEFENQNTQNGINFLQNLCDKLDNYEESIKDNDLWGVWEKYKHFVEVDIPSAKEFAKPVSPNECTRSIKEILESPKDQILELVSEHLGQLCANGAHTELLSKEEFNVYLIDEFISTVNSDGIDHYLYYNGKRFPLLCEAIRIIGHKGACDLMKRIKKKVKNVPDNADEEVWQAAIDKLEERGKDFEAEEDFYYEKVENELINSVCEYVLENSEQFK